MPKYLFQTSYTPEGLAGLRKDKASGRRQAVIRNLVLQLRLHTPAVVSPTRGLVVTHAPNDPLEQKTLGFSAQKNSAG